MRQRLGVASVVQDAGQSQVTGQGTVYDGLGTITLKNVNPDYSDSVSPDATAELAFLGNLGNAGIDKNGSYYRTNYLGFGAERLFSAADREQTLLRFLQWCDGLAGIDGDGDGVANAADCAPGDAEAWTAPSAVTDLRLSRGDTGFTWSQPVSGSGAVYDLLRSERPQRLLERRVRRVRHPADLGAGLVGRESAARPGLLLPRESPQRLRDRPDGKPVRRDAAPGNRLQVRTPG